MTQKHSPGPWKWEAGSGFAEQPRLVAADGRVVCDFGDDKYHETKCGAPPSDADAALIAAAPELLEALRGLATYGDPWSVAKERIEKARALLARIDGEEN